jgi:Na+-transporting methylmalonyl-CoA/oxaloacetate decarboxylase gamma subunit
MNVVVLILYMYGIAAVISFFVAFLIDALYAFIRFIEREKKPAKGTIPISTASLQNVQAEAKLMENEKEVMAAIAMALFLYSKELHDDETLKLTIKRSAKTYSPWSSKIYGLNTYKR